MLKALFPLLIVFLAMLSVGCEDYALMDQYAMMNSEEGETGEEDGEGDDGIVLPPVPENLLVENNGNKSIRISWSYPDTSLIDGFRIMRKEDSPGKFFQLVDDESTLGSGFTERTHNDLSPNTWYTYYMYAVSDGYLSQATAEFSAYSNP